MDKKSQTIIPLSRFKNILLVLGALLFIVLGFLIISLHVFRELYHHLFLQIAGYSAIIFFGMCLIVGLKKLFDKKPGLIINDKGIFDNSSGISIGLIPWNNITFIRTNEIISSKFLLIGISNAENIINSQNAFKRFWMKSNYKIYNTPIAISSGCLRIKFDELEKILIEKWNLYKNQAIAEIKPEEKQEKTPDYKLYTTGWMVAATFIGGPLAGFYLLNVNFKNLKKPQLAKKAFLKGIFISLVFFTAVLILPPKITNIIPITILPIIYCVLLGTYADIIQGSEIKSHIKSGGKKYSGWRAVSIGIVCLVLTLLYVVILALFFSFAEKYLPFLSTLK